MKLSWDDINEEDLKELYYDKNLSDKQIANMFGVSKGKVSYKKKKFGISFKNKVYQDFIKENSELFEQLNSNSKERLLRRDNIDSISKAITHFAFRNGPVEDMHANNQLSENDMKILNKYMVNRIAGILTAIADNNWLQLELLLSYYNLFGTNWDKAEPDVEEIDSALKYAIQR
jgi:predicted transcriptional regulator